jgi:hypothetical protein
MFWLALPFVLLTCWPIFGHRIDNRPEGSLLYVLAWKKRPKFFTCYDAILECTMHFVPMFVLWKTSVCTPGWRHMMAYFHVSTRKISDEISSEWPFWSSIYSVLRAWLTPFWIFVESVELWTGSDIKCTVRPVLTPVSLVLPVFYPFWPALECLDY